VADHFEARWGALDLSIVVAADDPPAQYSTVIQQSEAVLATASIPVLSPLEPIGHVPSAKFEQVQSRAHTVSTWSRS
jgi:TPP-dependent indolepyruvate ferredoxin oxidoreductase alpha subunit